MIQARLTINGDRWQVCKIRSLTIARDFFGGMRKAISWTQNILAYICKSPFVVVMAHPTNEVSIRESFSLPYELPDRL